MKILKRLKIKIFKGAIKTVGFLILFGLFFSSSAFAAALTVSWEGAIIPGGSNNFFPNNTNPNNLVCKSSQTGLPTGVSEILVDRTEEPSDIAFSDDGLTVFTTNLRRAMNGLEFSQNRLERPFDVLSDSVRAEPGGTCDDVDGLDVNTLSGGALNDKTEDIDFAKDGMIFFIMADFNQLGKFIATKPYDVDGLTYSGNRIVLPSSAAGTIDSVEFSRDGTKLFALDRNNNHPILKTYNIPGDYDIASATEIQSINLEDYGVIDTADENEQAVDLEFNSDGSALFVLIRNETNVSNSWIYQFSLSKKYDVSTAVKVGRFSLTNIFLARTSNLSGYPKAFGFAGDGMKLYILDNLDGIPGTDHINQFSLECPYGVVACVSETTSSIGVQVELAKQNITLNVSTVFKRFEWIKRNRDNEDLSVHNININYPNPLLKSLVNKFEPSLKNNLAALVSSTKKKEKNKKSKWSSWSLGDLTISNLDKLGFEKAKSIRTEGLTLGADRKFGDNKFLGWAIRYGSSHNEIFHSQQNVEMESLTLNLYGIIPRKNNQYINSVLGFSALRFDNKYLGKLSGERNGKQAFASINYRTKNTYGKFKITPSGKFTYGITRLSEYTDFLSKTVDGPATDVRYSEDDFRSGELAGGFLFEMDKFNFDKGSFQPMGSIEYLFDLTPHNDYKFTYQGSTVVNKDRILGKYSEESLKTNIGFELIYLNGFTLSTSYEAIKSMRKKSDDKYIDRFIIKISRSEEENSQFAFEFDPLTNNSANLSYAKDIGNFELKFNSKLSSINRISDYGADIKLSGTF